MCSMYLCMHLWILAVNFISKVAQLYVMSGLCYRGDAGHSGGMLDLFVSILLAELQLF